MRFFLLLKGPFLGPRGSSPASTRLAICWQGPTLPSVSICSVDLSDAPDMRCLPQLARVLPKVESLLLTNEEAGYFLQHPRDIDPEVFRPLLVCTSVRHLHLSMHVIFTTDWLVQLCNSLPLLSFLGYVRCGGVSLALLRRKLPLIQIKECSKSDMFLYDDFWAEEEHRPFVEENADVEPDVEEGDEVKKNLLN